MAMVKSRSAMVGRAPDGKLTWLMCTESPMSRPVRSMRKLCGMLATEHRTSISWRTTLSTPPRFSPGEATSFSNSTGTFMRISVSAPTRRKST